MKAAVLHAYNEPLKIAEVQIDEPRSGEVLLRTAASGVCHSDLHIIEGRLPAPPRSCWATSPPASSSAWVRT